MNEIQREWKAVKVASGKEEAVAEKLKDMGLIAYAPAFTAKERRRGAWAEVIRPLLPGYVLICVNWTAELYHTLKEMWYVQYPLSGVVDEKEIQYLRQYEAYSDRAVIDYSGGQVRYEGPIAEDVSRIVKVDRRRGRALVRIRLGEENESRRWLPVKIVRERNETST